MASLKAVRELLALRGRMAAAQISQLLATPQPMTDALLAHLERMGLAQRVAQSSSDCFTGSCRRCPESQRCQTELWMLVP